jgi:hypothetical protein
MPDQTQTKRPPRNRIFFVLLILVPCCVAGVLWLYRPLQPRFQERQREQPAASTYSHSLGDHSKASVLKDQCRKINSALRDFRSRQGRYSLPPEIVLEEKTAYPINAEMFAAVSGGNAAQVDYFKPWSLSAQTLAELKQGRFFVSFDLNDDSQVPDPAGSAQVIDQDVLVWHAGEDGDPQTWGDNVFGWLAK